MTIYFLHLRKSGGTAIKKALAEAGANVVLCEHEVTMRSVLRQRDKAFFVLRDPVERVVSGFYDRLREGAPAYDCQRTDMDNLVFSHYPTIEALCMDLESIDQRTHARAASALGALTHTGCRYWDWFGGRADLIARWRDILYVLFLPSLREDFATVQSLLGLSDIELTADAKKGHQAPAEHRKQLALEHVVALRHHYHLDYDFIRQLVEIVPAERISPSLLRWVSEGFPSYWRPDVTGGTHG